MLRAELALLAAGDGRLETGHAELARCQEIIAMGEDWRGIAGRVSVAAGMLAAAEGRHAEASLAFTAAVETFQAYGCYWDEAEARYSGPYRCRPKQVGNGTRPPTSTAVPALVPAGCLSPRTDATPRTPVTDRRRCVTG